jgi:iron complex transport system ATP-binding protein
VLLAAGRVAAAGTPAEALSAERVAAVFGVSVATVAHPRDGTPVLLPRA